jgi:plastocyanin
MNIVGVKGNSGINPTLMRMQDFAMVLTVINQDKVPHMLYVDGQDVNTIILNAGENQTITFYSPTEGAYNYYYSLSSSTQPMGQIKVTPFE